MSTQQHPYAAMPAPGTNVPFEQPFNLDHEGGFVPEARHLQGAPIDNQRQTGEQRSTSSIPGAPSNSGMSQMARTGGNIGAVSASREAQGPPGYPGYPGRRSVPGSGSTTIPPGSTRASLRGSRGSAVGRLIRAQKSKLACERCRKRKIKCDGESGDKCTACREAHQQECKYLRAGVVPVMVLEIPSMGPQVPYPAASGNGGWMGNF